MASSFSTASPQPNGMDPRGAAGGVLRHAGSMTWPTQPSCDRRRKLTEILQAMGFRAEAFDDANGAPACVAQPAASGSRSASASRPAAAEGFTDFTYIAVIKIMEGQFPLSASTNGTSNGDFANCTRGMTSWCLTSTCSCGRVTEGYVRQTVGLWDRLIQDLVIS